MHRRRKKRCEPAKDIEAMIKSQIRSRLGQSLQNLRVDLGENHLVLSGQASSFYAKQLAQHVAMKVSSLPVCNEIEVS